MTSREKGANSGKSGGPSTSKSLRDYRDRLLAAGSAQAAETRSSRSAGKASDKGSARQLRTEAIVAFEKLFVAQQDIGSLFCSITKAAENVEIAVALRQRLIDCEVQWLGVMQRLLSDNSAWCPDMLPFLRVMVLGASPLLHRVVIGGKLSSLLLVPSAPKDVVAAIVVHCLSTPENIDQFLHRQEGLPNLATALSTAAAASSANDTYSFVMLVANVLGRHPASVTDLVGAKLDASIANIGLSTVCTNFITEGAVMVMKAVLYCLRFFVRVRAEDTNFIETCLSLSAHSATALPVEATDLCGDMCAVVKDFRFARKNRNIFLNLVAMVPKMNSSRALHIMRFMTSYLQHCHKDVKAQFSVYAVISAMVLTKDCCGTSVTSGAVAGEPEAASDSSNATGPLNEALAIQLIDLLLAAVEAGTLDVVQRHIDFRVLAAVRSFVFSPGQGINTPGKVRFLTFLFQLVQSGAPHLGVSRIILPFAEVVGTHVSDEVFMQLNGGAPMMRMSQLRSLDKRVDAHLRGCRHQAAEVESNEASARESLETEGREETAQLRHTMAMERAAIEATPREIEFRVLDRSSIVFDQQRRSALQQQLADWQASSAAAIADIKEQYAKDSSELVTKLSTELEARLRASSFADREKQEIRTRYRIKAEDQRRKLRLTKETALSDRRWRQQQGTLFLQRLTTSAEAEITQLHRGPLITCEYCEEISRGFGFSGVYAVVPAQSEFVSITQSEAVAWRGIERQAEKIFAPQKFWVSRWRDQVLAVESREERLRLELTAVVVFKFLELEFVEGIELYAVNRSKRMMPFYHLHLSASLSSFGASYGMRPADSLSSMLPLRAGGGAAAAAGSGLRRVPSKRRSLSLLTSEARDLQVCQEQEEIFRCEVEQQGLIVLIVSRDLLMCLLQEERSRAFVWSLFTSHLERGLQCLESLGRMALENDRRACTQFLMLQVDECDDRHMIENEEGAVAEFMSCVEVGESDTLVDALLSMIEPASETEHSMLLILSASNWGMLSSTGYVSRSST